MNVQTSIAKRGITAEQIAANYAALEADLSVAIQEALLAGAKSGQPVADQIEAFLRSGDLPGLERYLRGLMDPAFNQVTAILRRVIAKAMLAPAAVRAALKREGIEVLEDVLLRTKLPDGTVVTVAMPGAPTYDGTLPVNVVWTDLPPAMKVVHDRMIRLSATNFAAMAKELDASRHQMINEALRWGAENNKAPAQVARRIKGGLPLTAYQNSVVASFKDTLTSIATSGPDKAGITSKAASRWGIWTPRQIAALKADPSAAAGQQYRLLNFTPTEELMGRRRALMTRQTGTLAPGAGGLKPSRALGQQTGQNAWRLVQNGPNEGDVADFVEDWRLRSKVRDGYIFDVARATDDVVAAREALQAAKGPDKVKAQAALDRALAARQKAKARLAEVKDAWAEEYRARWVRHRSKVIARTEVMRAANGSTIETAYALVESGIVEPWQVFGRLRTAEDERVRNSHQQAARLNGARNGGRGVRIAMGELFEIPGEGREGTTHRSHPPLSFNCRCVVTLSIDFEAKP